MTLVETPLMGTLSRALDLTSLRQSLVSQNVANIDTPGYQARDIDFRQELQRALGEDEGRHRSAGGARGAGPDRAAGRQQRQPGSREPADGPEPALPFRWTCNCCAPSSIACSWRSTEATDNEPVWICFRSAARP